MLCVFNAFGANIFAVLFQNIFIRLCFFCVSSSVRPGEKLLSIGVVVAVAVFCLVYITFLAKFPYKNTMNF